MGNNKGIRDGTIFLNIDNMWVSNNNTIDGTIWVSHNDTIWLFNIGMENHRSVR